MKKYTLFLVVFSFIFSFLTFFSNASAMSVISTDSQSVPGCALGDKYSRKTGEQCSEPKIREACASGDLFNSTTGQPCEKIKDNYCYDLYMKLKMGSRGDEVKLFQQKLKDEGFTPGKIDGIYGKMTSEASARYYKIRPCYPNSSSVVISGVKGPQLLDVNQMGTWTVSAYNKDGGDLSYSVVWGDENTVVYPTSASSSLYKQESQQSATFTHSYSQAGTYKPTFTVTSPNTMRCFQAPCPSNGGSAQTSLSVVVGSTPIKTGTLYIEPSSISLQVGESQGVTAYYQPPMPACSSGLACPQLMPAHIKIDPIWSISNKDVAGLDYITCASLGGCGVSTIVRAISKGTTELTAKYTPIGGTELTARAKVVVSSQ